MRKIAFLLFLIPVLVFPEYLIANRPGIVKKSPEKESDIIFRVQTGDILTLISDEQKNGYYKVKASSSTKKGWIYRTFVKRIEGTPPSENSPLTSSNDALTCYYGIPKSINPDNNITLLKNIGYWVGYSESYKNPLWSSYRLYRVENPQSFPRPKKFKMDDRTISKICHEDYTNSGYDRGHMAPNSAICTRYGEDAQKETFFMSNICPQCPGCNEETWEAFEKVEREKYANDFDEIWSIAGPIFSSSPDTISHGVSIPEKFYKIIVTEDEDKNVFMLGIIMGQTTKGTHQIHDFIATVDSIETLTGLDFFSELPDSIENYVESTLPENDLWDLNQNLEPQFHARTSIESCQQKSTYASEKENQ